MIGGNTKVIIQTQTTTKNSIGEKVKEWCDFITLNGFLDYMSGDGGYKNNFKGDVEETSHLFICDYVNLNINSTTARMIIDNKVFDILSIDDPMNLHKHLEFMLKYNEVIK